MAARNELETDYLVIGSGLAGLYFALNASEHGHVTVVATKAPDAASTAWAQGGIAGVFAAEDSFEKHVQDTLTVGDGLCRRDVVELCVREAPRHIRELDARYGATFGKMPDGSFE